MMMTHVRSSIWMLWCWGIWLTTTTSNNIQSILALSTSPTTRVTKSTTSTLQSRPHERVLSFDTVKYPLQELVADALECHPDELGLLHCRAAEDFAAPGSIRGSQAATRAPLRSLELLRRALSEKWKRSPQKRIWENEYLPQIVRNVVGSEIFPTEPEFLIYQRAPMLRFHVAWPLEPEEMIHYDDTIPPIGGRNPGTLAGLHTDHEYGHPSGEVNFFLPVTPETFDTNSLFVEGEAMRGDFEPFRLQYGEIMMWSGNDCRHCSPRNVSNQTRISFDFRVIPGSDWEEPSSAEHSFQLGSYYMNAFEMSK